MPNLTTEELKALEDQMNAEQLLIKKFRSYSVLTADPQIRTQCEQIACRHQDHFNRLMGYLG